MNDIERLFEQLRVDRDGEESLPQGVAAGIDALIDAGALKPGDVLPRTRRLAELLGVSVQVVQEACTRLADRGRVERRRRTGTVVRGRQPTGVVGVLTAIDLTLPQQANPGWLIAQEAALDAERYDLDMRHYLLRESTGRLVLPENLVADLKERALDALLVGAVYADVVRQNIQTPTPVIHIGVDNDGLSDSVEDAVRWLWRADVERPALVLESVHVAPIIEAAFVEAATAFRLDVRDGHIVRDVPSRIAQGKPVYDRLFAGDSPPDGLVVMDDMVGFGVLREIETRGGPDPARVIVMTNKGSSLHIDERCPQVEIDYGVMVDRAMAEVATKYEGNPVTPATNGRPVYRFRPPRGAEREAGGGRRET